MRRVEPSATRYSVQISPSAWEQIASLPADTYRHVREELENVADRVAVAPPPVLPREKGPAALAFMVEEYVVLYDVDTERRSVLLLEVALRQPRYE